MSFADIFAAFGCFGQSRTWQGQTVCPACRRRPEGVYIRSETGIWLQPCGHPVDVDWLRSALPADGGER